jgi:hypothetical protein
MAAPARARARSAGRPEHEHLVPGSESIVGWLLFLTVGPLLLAGYLGYVCRGPRRPRMTERQIRELQVLSGLEKDEDLRH